jgi:hypothetical protein
LLLGRRAHIHLIPQSQQRCKRTYHLVVWIDSTTQMAGVRRACG